MALTARFVPLRHQGVLMTTCKESELARAVLDAQAALARAERGPIDTAKLDQARRRESRALDDWRAFRNGTSIPRRP